MGQYKEAIERARLIQAQEATRNNALPEHLKYQRVSPEEALPLIEKFRFESRLQEILREVWHKGEVKKANLGQGFQLSFSFVERDLNGFVQPTSHTSLILTVEKTSRIFTIPPGNLAVEIRDHNFLGGRILYTAGNLKPVAPANKFADWPTDSSYECSAVWGVGDSLTEEIIDEMLERSSINRALNNQLPGGSFGGVKYIEPIYISPTPREYGSAHG